MAGGNRIEMTAGQQETVLGAGQDELERRPAAEDEAVVGGTKPSHGILGPRVEDAKGGIDAEDGGDTEQHVDA